MQESHIDSLSPFIVTSEAYMLPIPIQNRLYPELPFLLFYPSE